MWPLPALDATSGVQFVQPHASRVKHVLARTAIYSCIPLSLLISSPRKMAGICTTTPASINLHTERHSIPCILNAHCHRGNAGASPVIHPALKYGWWFVAVLVPPLFQPELSHFPTEKDGGHPGGWLGENTPN